MDYKINKLRLLWYFFSYAIRLYFYVCIVCYTISSKFAIGNDSIILMGITSYEFLVAVYFVRSISMFKN
jgi:hypothetical protein